MDKLLYVTGFCLAVSVGFTNGQDTCILDRGLGQNCTSVCPCSSNNATCSGRASGICQCVSTHYDDTGTSDFRGACRIKIDVGGFCPLPFTGVLPTASCSDPNATCIISNGITTCQCNSEYFNYDLTCKPKVKVGAICPGFLRTDSCSDPYATCTWSSEHYICQCNPGYYHNGVTCTPKSDLGQFCTDVNQCNDSNIVCSVTCQCASTHYDDTGIADIGGSCVQKVKVGAFCPGFLITDSCSDPYATCTWSSEHYICQCNPGYYHNGVTCIPKSDLGQFCTDVNQCNDSNIVCSVTCQCASTHYDDTGTADIGGSCVQKVKIGGICPGFLITDSCSGSYATCTWLSEHYICQCNPGYYHNGVTCIPKSDLGQYCTNVNQCNDSNIVCLGTCQCASTHYDDTGTANIGGSCVQKVDVDQKCQYKLTTDVQITSVCSDASASCRLSSKPYTCQCNEGYYNNSGTCTLQRYLGETCRSMNECIDIKAICSWTCQCAPTHYDNTGTADIGGYCVQKIDVGGSCTGPATGVLSTTSCSDQFATCVSLSSGQYNCQCNIDYVYNAGKCTPETVSQIGGICENSYHCSDRNAVCQAISKTCQCAEGFQNVEGICEVLNTVSCECANEGKCIDGKCYCLEGYFGLHCESLLSQLADSCENSYYCHDRNAVCQVTSKTCQCAEGFHDVDGICEVLDTVLSNIDGPCENSYYCYDRNAVCQVASNTCQCAEGFQKVDGTCEIVNKTHIDESTGQSSENKNKFAASELASAAGSAFAAAVALCLVVVYVCRLRTHRKLCFRNNEPTSTDKIENASKPVTMKVHQQHQSHETLYDNRGCNAIESAITTTEVTNGLAEPKGVYETLHPENGNPGHVYAGIATIEMPGSGGNIGHRKPASLNSDDKIAMTDHVYLDLIQSSNIS